MMSLSYDPPFDENFMEASNFHKAATKAHKANKALCHKAFIS
jgi:hypothetical protein